MPTHYAWWNVTGCAGRQMTAAPTSSAQDLAQRIGMILMMVILGPIAAALTVVSFIVCCCCTIPLCLSEDGGFLVTFSFISYLWLMLLTAILLVRPCLCASASLRWWRWGMTP